MLVINNWVLCHPAYLHSLEIHSDLSQKKRRIGSTFDLLILISSFASSSVSDLNVNKRPALSAVRAGGGLMRAEPPPPSTPTPRLGSSHSFPWKWESFFWHGCKLVMCHQIKSPSQTRNTRNFFLFLRHFYLNTKAPIVVTAVGCGPQGR